jgi:glycosyltransferase involved in cell wall biosynthesis
MRDIRILVVDDGSTDDTAEMLSKWALRDERIEILSKPNSGIVDALNAGLARCSAAYIARFDADDISFPERLAQQYAYLKSNTNCVAVGCAVRHIDETGKTLYGLPHPGPPGRGEPNRIPALEPYIIHPFLMARRDAVSAAGGYRHVPSSEDSDLYWRLAEIGNLHNLEQTLGEYRMHQHSISGASIVNGRMMAIGSQLAAVSARRRRSGQPDIQFDSPIYSALRKAETLDKMCAYAETLLLGDEIGHFRLAVGIKLLELGAYRPFLVQRSDCVFIRRSLRFASHVPAEDRRQIRWHVIETARRLIQRGDFELARSLTPPAFYARAAAKTLASTFGLLASKAKASKAAFA